MALSAIPTNMCQCNKIEGITFWATLVYNQRKYFGGRGEKKMKESQL